MQIYSLSIPYVSILCLDQLKPKLVYAGCQFRYFFSAWFVLRFHIKFRLHQYQFILMYHDIDMTKIIL